jgi:hypothetical protein
MRVLAITVGGSPDPVVQSIRDHSPDFVLFFVTKGPNGGSRVQLTQGPSGGPGILTETRVPDGKFREVVIEHYDDLAYCYKLMRDTLRATQEEFPGSEFIADYTGGTKSMSAALSMAAARLK